MNSTSLHTALALGALAACARAPDAVLTADAGDEPAGDASSCSQDPSPEDFCNRFYSALSHEVATCLEEDELRYRRIFEGLALRTCLSASQRASVGRIAYDARIATECIASLTNMGCAAAAYESFVPGAPCDGVFTGTVGLDAPCVTQECAPGLVCDDGALLVVPGSDVRVGTCSNLCVPVAGSRVVGAECGLGQAECLLGLFCRGAEGSSHCQEPANIGQSCALDGLCASGLFCRSRDQTCQPPAEYGAECDQASPLSTSGCADPRLRCLPNVGGTSYTCRQAPKLGETCSPFLPCAGIQYCGPRGVCERMAVLGERCSDDRPCTASWCTGGFCAPYALPGGECTEDLQCVNRQCRSGICSTGCSGL